MEMKYSVNLSSFRQKLRQHEANLPRRAYRLAELIGREVVKNALTKTSNTKPGANKGDGPRYTYPGGWADITTNLANSIDSKAQTEGMTAEAIIEATMEYAEELNAREGYEVLGGADRLAREAIEKYKHEIFS